MATKKKTRPARNGEGDLLNVKCEKDEKRRWRFAAALANQNLSVWVRKRLTQVADRELAGKRL